MKTLRIIVAFFHALLTLAGFIFISVVIYSEFSVPFNFICSLALFIFGSYASRSIFIMMKRRGVIATMSAVHQSSDLDVIEPSNGNGILQLTPEELRNHFIQSKLELNPCTVSIFGDWEGRQLDIRHSLKFVEFNSEKNILTLTFSDKCVLKIRKPKLIYFTTTYLKIVHAKEILWQVPNEPKTPSQFSYLNSKYKITTQSNTDWKPHEYDVGPGMDAIYLQG